MVRTTTAFCAIIVVIATSSLPAEANDASFGGAGGTVAPMKEDRVRMKSEHIRMRLVSTSETDDTTRLDTAEWRVEAHYEFENTTDDKVELTVGFPELACSPGSTCPEDDPYTIRGFQTQVDGTEVDHRVEKADELDDGEKLLESLGRIYLFDVTFEPGETVEITHNYTHAPSRSVDGFQVTYLTRTGRLWKGSIGEATFEVRVPKRHYYLAHRNGYELVEREHSTEIGGDWRYTFRVTDWEPQEDFHVHFGNFVSAPGPRCPRISNFDKAYDMVVGTLSCDDDGVRCEDGEKELSDQKQKDVLAETGREFVESARVFAEEDSSAKYSTEELSRICGNLPRAIHGYPFDDKMLRATFYVDSYRARCQYCGPEGGDDEKPKRPTPWTRAFHAPNADYDEALLSPTERQYIRAFEHAAE